MIYIYCDFDHFVNIQRDEQTWIVQHPDEYILLRKKLRCALNDEDHDFTVYVCSPLLAKWLADLRGYGEKVVLWEFIDARRQAEDHLGFSLPDEFDTPTIQTLNVLSLQPPTYTLDPEGWLLKQFLGTSVWEIIEPDTEHLGKLAIWAASFTEQVHPVLHQLAERRLKLWSQKDERYRYFSQHEWHRTGSNILLRWTLRRYPASFLEKVGLNETPVVSLTEDQDQYIALLQEHKPTNELRRYWSLFFARQESSPSDLISVALSQMSGTIEDELEAISLYLSNRSITLSLSLLERVRRHFRLLPMSKAVLDRLEELIPPPIPAQPDNQWDAADWLHWAAEEYIPYFAWIVRTKQSRQNLVQFVDSFSDWFVSMYPRLIFDQHAPFHFTYLHYICQIKQENPNVVVIWGIIDGLAWWQGKLLASEFMQKQLYVHRSEPTLVALPSVTSVSKRALVRGYVTATDGQQSIARIARERLSSDFGATIICSDPQELVNEANTHTTPGIYVLLYNGLDAHNHESTTFTDDESVKGYLRAIAEAIANTVLQIRRNGFEVRVVISSDHGSTLLPENAIRLDPPSYIQPLDDEGEEGSSEQKQSITLRSRACKMSREPNLEEISRLEDHWYILNKDKFGLADTLLIPRGYAYAKRRPRGWTHGGATPEETVVPFIEVSPLPLKILSPEIGFEGDLLVQRSTTVSVTITNPNPFPLSRLHFSIVNDGDTASLAHLAASSSGKIDVVISPAAKEAKSVQLDWLLRCQIIGHAYEFTGTVNLPIRRFQVSKVDELFGDLL
jgi:hypothetical protein